MKDPTPTPERWKGNPKMRDPTNLVPSDLIEKKIFLLRSQKVMLSGHLAELYQVQPQTLNQAVKRNMDRFPEDFMFQLSWDELSFLKSQSVISNDPGATASRS